MILRGETKEGGEDEFLVIAESMGGSVCEQEAGFKDDESAEGDMSGEAGV